LVEAAGYVADPVVVWAPVHQQVQKAVNLPILNCSRERALLPQIALLMQVPETSNVSSPSDNGEHTWAAFYPQGNVRPTAIVQNTGRYFIQHPKFGDIQQVAKFVEAVCKVAIAVKRIPRDLNQAFRIVSCQAPEKIPFL